MGAGPWTENPCFSARWLAPRIDRLNSTTPATPNTAGFMQEFSAALRDGHQPALALLEVRRRHVERDRNEHPSRWAAFVPVGTVQR